MLIPSLGDYFAPTELLVEMAKRGYKHSAPNGAEAIDFVTN